MVTETWAFSNFKSENGFISDKSKVDKKFVNLWSSVSIKLSHNVWKSCEEFLDSNNSENEFK
jgi:hypothetical protein